jgi:hypothetical protein
MVTKDTTTHGEHEEQMLFTSEFSVKITGTLVAFVHTLWPL